MAAITQTSMVGAVGEVTITRTALGASDTLTYDTTTSVQQLLVLYNTTASPVVVTIDGSGGTTITPPGYGGTVSVASGKAITVGADATVAVKLRNISAFLQGTVAVTGGTGVTAHLIKLS